MWYNNFILQYFLCVQFVINFQIFLQSFLGICYIRIHVCNVICPSVLPSHFIFSFFFCTLLISGTCFTFLRISPLTPWVLCWHIRICRGTTRETICIKLVLVKIFWWTFFCLFAVLQTNPLESKVNRKYCNNILYQKLSTVGSSLHSQKW